MTAQRIPEDLSPTAAGIAPAAFAGRAAIFDFDGTVADSLGVWEQVDRAFFAQRKLTYDTEYANALSILGFEDGARYTIERYGLSETVQEICDEWNRMGRELYRTDVQLRPGAACYIRRLRAAGIRIGLATTNAPDVLDAMQPRVPLDGLFDVRVHGCEVAIHTKDHPDIYAECARRLGVEPHDCTLFEDLPIGLQSAAELGMTCVGVINHTPNQNIETLFEHARYVMSDWNELV